VPSKKTGDAKLVLSVSQGRRGKYIVSLPDEKLRLSSSALTEFYIYKGKEITPREYREIMNYLKTEQLLNYGMRLASTGAYSTHCIREKLRLHSEDEEEVRKVIFSLKKNGLLDDEEYAKEYAEELSARLYGKKRILETLRFDKGISGEILLKVSFDKEEEHAARFLTLSNRKYASLPLNAKKTKLGLALRRRGYDEPTIAVVLHALRAEPSAEAKSLRLLCEKTVKRYANKYNKYELRGKCFAYLLSKGYRSEDVSQCLEETMNEEHR
jgi:regulatory protein